MAQDSSKNDMEATMNNGKKLVAVAVMATAALATSAPASADGGAVAAGVVLGMMTGAAIASSHPGYYVSAPPASAYQDGTVTTYYSSPAPVYYAPRPVYYSAPAYYPVPVPLYVGYGRRGGHYYRHGYRHYR
ncbi:MAG: hypothetical protein H6R04_1068 [Burkholderiaceae bacterium]|nr:hypothetical protein [Burkholderiaceae bacterium]